MSVNWLNYHHALGYFLEIIVAELLFVHSFKKRDYFWIRFGIYLIVMIPVMSNVDLYRSVSTLVRLAYLFAVIAVSIIGMVFIFDAPFLLISSSCIAGVAAQHIGNKTLALILLIPFFNKITAISPLYFVLADITVLAIVYLLIYFLVARDYSPQKSSRRLNVISVAIVIICIGVNRLVADHSAGNIYYEVASCIYAIICCILALAIQLYLYRWQQEQTESSVIKELLTASEKQYEQWKAMVEFVRVQTHDLKHMLDRVERLSGKDNTTLPDLSPIRETISGFSPLVKTGNDVIDVLLRNMNTLCVGQNIRFNCVSYTDSLGAYDSMSLYFLFANAIDNARAAADLVTDPDKRLIDVSIREFGDSITIHIWNYYEGDISFEKELPIRSSEIEGTGYGVKSIKMLVDKFEGALNAYTDGDIFHLNIILPCY